MAIKPYKMLATELDDGKTKLIVLFWGARGLVNEFLHSYVALVSILSYGFFLHFFSLFI